MAYPRSKAAWLTVGEIVSAQLFIIALAAGITQLRFETVVTQAIIWGYVAHIFPNLLFASCLFRNRTYSPQRFLRRFYRAEVTKILLTVLLLALLYNVFANHVAALLIGYALAHMGAWFALPWQGRHRTFI